MRAFKMTPIATARHLHRLTVGALVGSVTAVTFVTTGAGTASALTPKLVR
jgi:hypothetical protein